MRFRTWLPWAGAVGLVLAVAATAYLTRQTWMDWLRGPEPAAKADDHDHGGEVTKVQISPQAEAGLQIEAKPIRLREYWRALEVPGSVVDRPGESDRAVPAPAAGVVTGIARRPGDTVRPGDPLFTIRVVGEFVQNAQAELHKTARELQLTAETRERLSRPDSGTPPGRLIELDQQERRLRAAADGSRQLLLTAGFRPEQVAQAEKGTFAAEIQVAVPAAPAASTGEPGPLFEVQELKVHVGDPVQSGQTVFLLADHRFLYVEGRAFKQEAQALARAAREAWPVRVEFVDERAGQWPELGPLAIHHLANMVDPETRTFAFYLPLPNQSEPYTRDGRTYLTWRFRPGQRARLRVPVERWDGVFVLPTDGVVREGAEAYVFRRNGDFFERRAVAVLHEDSTEVVLKDDGAISPGQHVVRTGAAALNRALKAAQASGGGGGVHVHADGTVHGNH